MTYRFWRNLTIVVLILLLVVAGVVNYIVESSTGSQLYTDIKLIPKNKVGLLLGTAKYEDKARKIINTYYQNRIDATVQLYMAGKIDYIIVSGDNGSKYYNEPALMKADLIARGIPTKKIYMDNAGFRTLDSILRCRDIFGQESFTIISQEFHDRRALYIANHKHVIAVAFKADDGDTFWDAQLREKFARVKMVADLIFNTQARYYGEQVVIP
jgi:SanA protein